jgi:hypothetical protein
MNGWGLRRFGRRWANHRLQARPGFAWLFVLSPQPGLPEPDRSPCEVRLLELSSSRCDRKQKPDSAGLTFWPEAAPDFPASSQSDLIGPACLSRDGGQ